MSDFLGRPPAGPRPQPKPDQACTLEMLATLFVVVLLVTMLYVGREIFIPIAIAIPVRFLSPPVLMLRRLGLGRVPSVLTVVLAALVIACSVSAVLTRQVSELAVDLPLSQATINAKLDDLRDAAADNALFAKVSAALKKLGEINPHRPAPSSAPAPSDQPKNRLTKGQESERPRFQSRFTSQILGLSRLWKPSPEQRCRLWRGPSSSSSSSSSVFCNARICATASSDLPDRAICTARPWR